jgi:hypothetical protein
VVVIFKPDRNWRFTLRPDIQPLHEQVGLDLPLLGLLHCVLL